MSFCVSSIGEKILDLLDTALWRPTAMRVNSQEGHSRWKEKIAKNSIFSLFINNFYAKAVILDPRQGVIRVSAWLNAYLYGNVAFFDNAGCFKFRQFPALLTGNWEFFQVILVEELSLYHYQNSDADNFFKFMHFLGSKLTSRPFWATVYLRIKVKFWMSVQITSVQTITFCKEL